MAKRKERFNETEKELLVQVQQIIEKYKNDGIQLTLRQLYYQLVSKNLIPNENKNYKKLSSLLTAARYAGIISWDAIEDRIRIPTRPSQFENVKDLVEAAIRSYRLNRWKGQEYYVEVFCEKDALSSVLLPITKEYHVYLNINRGYSSATAMHDAAERFIKQAVEEDKKGVLLYIGDHDPSGVDMIRDVSDRLSEFGTRVQVIPIALTMEQIRQYNPPPNPAKRTDTRSTQYVEQYGSESWEADALPPNVLNNILRVAIERFVNKDLMNDIIKQEEADKTKLVSLAEGET